MNSLFSKHRWMQVMWGILLFVAGAITIIFAVTSKGEDVALALGIAIAVVLFAYGLTIIFSSFLELKDGFFKYEIIIGAFVVAVGVVFCINHSLVADIIVSIIYVSLITFGLIFGIRAVLAIVSKQKVWWMPLCIVLAVLFIAAGILCLIFRRDVLNACYIVLGAILIIVGIIEVYMSIKRALESNSIGIEHKERKSRKSSKKKENKAAKVEEKEVVAEETPLIDVSTSENTEEKNEIVVK